MSCGGRRGTQNYWVQVPPNETSVDLNWPIKCETKLVHEFYQK